MYFHFDWIQFSLRLFFFRFSFFPVFFFSFTNHNFYVFFSQTIAHVIWVKWSFTRDYFSKCFHCLLKFFNKQQRCFLPFFEILCRMNRCKVFNSNNSKFLSLNYYFIIFIFKRDCNLR